MRPGMRLILAMLLVCALQSAWNPASAASGKRRANEIAYVAFMPDGTWNLRMRSVPTGEDRRLAPGYDAREYAFSPDGKRIAFLGRKRGTDSPSSDLWLLDTLTGECKSVAAGLWGDGAIAWRPGAEEVVVGRSGGFMGEDHIDSDGGVWRVDLGTGALTQLIAPVDSDTAVVSKIAFSADGSTVAITRSGRYAVVAEVGDPSRWLRLDRPLLLNPAYLLDLEWLGKTKSLLIAASTVDPSAHPSVDERWSKTRGPGGVWRWSLSEHTPAVAPALTIEDESKLLSPEAAGSSAEFVCRKGTAVHSLAVSHSLGRLAFLSPDGLYLRNMKTGKITLLAKVDRMRKRIAAYMTELDWPQVAAVSWSPDDSLILVAADREACLVDASTGKEIAAPWLGKSGMYTCWRPKAGQASR